MKAETLPWPALSGVLGVEPEDQEEDHRHHDREDHRATVAQQAAHLQPQQGQVEAAPRGGTRRVLRSTGAHRVVSFGAVVAGEGDEGVLEAAGVDLEVVGVGVGQQVAGHRVGVAGVDQHGVAAHLDGVGARDGPQRLRRGAGHRRPDGPAGGHRLDLGRGAVGHDPPLAHQDDPVGVGVRLLEVVRGEEHGAPPGSASCRMAAQKSRRPSTSMPVVGSSRMSSSGSDSRAMANRSRCCSPPEHLHDATVGDAGDAGPLEHLGDRVGWRANRLAVSSHRLGDGEVLQQAARLHHGRDEAARDGAGRREAVDLDLAAGRAAPAPG